MTLVTGRVGVDANMGFIMESKVTAVGTGTGVDTVSGTD